MRLFFLSISVLVAVAVTAQTKQVQYLSGTGSDKTVTWDFFCTGGRQSGYWTKIQVPSCWEQQGFGNYNYGRDYKTNGKNFRFYDEQGIYKYNFPVPASWKNRRVFIVFEGSMTDTEVKINGKSAGEKHQGAFYQFKYDITDQLKFGSSNTLETTVSKMSSDASVNNAERLADYWVFGGIFRPVFLESVPREYINYTAVNARADGNFSMQVFLKGNRQPGSVAAIVRDGHGKEVGLISEKYKAGDSLVTLHYKFDKVSQWTAETPSLYTVEVALKNKDAVVYKTTEKFGFRTIEIRRGDGIYLNGVQIKMKGVNRHCFWPETGRTLSDSQQLLDVKLIKEMNMNAVRCSHYPPDKKFLQLCDSLGLYVLDELAGWQKYYNTQVGQKLVKEMVQRDLNHPSIIFWDNGNEGGTNKELDKEFVKWDYSNRPVIHPHHRPGNEFNGIDCNHYEDYYSTQKILNDSLIYMPTEFLHSQDDGGGGAAMSDFWELHWNAKRSGGGFIWAMIDESIARTDFNNVLDANGLNANDGILGPHREKEGSFFALKEVFSPVRINMQQIPEQFNGDIEVENRYHFTNLRKCNFQWALADYYQPQDRFSGAVIRQKGIAVVDDVDPLKKGKIHLSLPADYKKYDALILVATDPFKNEIYKWIWKIRSNADLLGKIITSTDSLALFKETDTTYSLQGGEVSVSFNRKTGMLQSVKNSSADKVSFTGGPMLVPGNSLFSSSKHYKEGNNEVVEFSGSSALKYARWKMMGNGWLSLEYEYHLNGVFPFAGISFNYPENFMLGAKWLGKGPYRQWKNRLQGTPVNLWENLYNNTQTSYGPIIYPEFKGYYGEITWMQFNTVEGKFYVASKDTGLYVRLFDFYGLTGAKPFPELPAGNISFLDHIPPIGTKLALTISTNTSALGPQSEPARIDRPVKRTLYFYFGSLKTEAGKELYSRPAIDNVF